MFFSQKSIWVCNISVHFIWDKVGRLTLGMRLLPDCAFVDIPILIAETLFDVDACIWAIFSVLDVWRSYHFNNNYYKRTNPSSNLKTRLEKFDV